LCKFDNDYQITKNKIKSQLNSGVIFKWLTLFSYSDSLKSLQWGRIGFFSGSAFFISYRYKVYMAGNG